MPAVRGLGIKPDSLDDVFDPSAARVVLPLKSYAEELAKKLNKHLFVDAEKSQNIGDRLGDNIFGYVIQHLFVQIQPLRLKPRMKTGPA